MTETQEEKVRKFDELVRAARFKRDLKVLGDRYGVFSA